MGEILNMFIAITAALSTVVPAEIARLILAAAVGYTIANRMSGSADDDDDKEDIEENHDDVKNSIPSMIAFSTDDESRPALTKSSTLSSMDMSDRLSTSGEPPGKLTRQRSLLIMNEDEEEEEDEMLHILETVLTKRKHRRLSLSEEVDQDEVMMMDKQRPQLRRPRLTKSQSEYNSSEWKEQTPRPKLLRPQLTKSQSEYNSSEWKNQTRPKARPRLMMKAQSEYNSSGWQQDQGQGSKETQDDIRLTTRRNSLARMPSISFHLGRNRRRSA